MTNQARENQNKRLGEKWGKITMNLDITKFKG